jgi:Holliday junction resolvase RusA-like endonuclease
MVEDNPRHADWRARVALAARQAHSGPPLTGALCVRLTFTFDRPRSHYGTGRNTGTIRPSAPQHKTTKPDLDKLVRAVCDSLTKIVWTDDAQVVRLIVDKRWTVGLQQPGALIQVTPEHTLQELMAG